LNTHKIRFMNRAFELAQLGLGSVSPNPMVGCVIVHNNQIIGEGWHKKYGGPHAEVNAINSVENKSILSESTAYVSLEPCAHQGKTPPCADLLIEHKLKRVVISNKDPFPLVNGGGIKKLENENIEVETDLLDKKGREINKRFFTLIEKKRPYIILKWAQTVDGFIARENFDSKWISNEYSRKLVHKWRSEEDAILVGTNTAEYDNPTLNVRDWEGRDPIRLVIDKQLKLDTGLNLFDGSIPTICYNSLQDGESENLIFKKVDDENLIEAILSDLYARKIQSLIVEGGSQLLNSFIEKNLWDEARIFSSKKIFVNGIEAPKIAGQLVSSEDLKGDRLQVYKKINS
jgi:diaminohydroxyphosphoribosylaminopyrimidine deaminase / 5-amino-6-(5-phosphoribosylamino)uracil reductase